MTCGRADIKTSNEGSFLICISWEVVFIKWMSLFVGQSEVLVMQCANGITFFWHDLVFVSSHDWREIFYYNEGAASIFFKMRLLDVTCR